MSTYSAQLALEAPVSHLGTPLGAPQPLQLRLLRTQGGLLLLTIVAVALLAFAALLAYARIEQAPQALALGGAFFTLAAGAGWSRRQASRGQVELFEGGLALTRSGRTLALAWEEIADLSVSVRDELVNGTSQGAVLRLDARAGTKRLRFEHFRALQGSSELIDLVFRGLRKAADAAERRLKAGEALRGRGWTLEQGGLRTPTLGLVSLRDVRAVAVFEDKVSLWRAGEDEPFFATPAAGPNACLLHELARRHVPEGAADSDTSALGRVLFKKKASRATVIFFALVALLLALPGLLVLRAPEADTLAMGVGLLVGGLLCGWGAWWAHVTRFQCQTRGVLRQTPFGTRVLKYADIQTFRYAATRMYHNGAYTGTSVSFAFVPAPPEKPIAYATTTRGNDADLEFLRDSVAQIVAGTLHAHVKAGADMRWGKSARLTATELRYRAKKLLGQGEEQLVRLDADLRFSIDQGVFHLFVPGAQKSVLDIACAEDNFYPGLLLFQRLAAEAHRGR